MNLDHLKIIGNDDTGSELSGASIHQAAVTDLTKPVERPPLAISIGEDDTAHNGIHYPLRFATFGNISLIKGEQKARKSFAKSLILACALGGKANNYSDKIRGYLGRKWVVDIDAEQDEYDAATNAKRIPRMVGAIPPNYINVQLRRYTKDERRRYLRWLFTESEYRHNLGLVFMDGYVDFVKDFNNQEQSDEFVQELMTYSADCRCHISGILHVNYASDKGRGHLGTILQQKCETIAIVKKNGTQSQLICENGRGKDFETVTFKIDSDWLPYEVEGQGVVEGYIENNLF